MKDLLGKEKEESHPDRENENKYYIFNIFFDMFMSKINFKY